MKPLALAVAGGLVFGVGMYTLGAKTTQVEALTQTPAVVEPLAGQYVPASYSGALRPAAVPVSAHPAVRRRTVPRTTAAVEDRVVVSQEDPQSDRSWQKTTMIIGGSAASGAGVGAIAGGKKGAMIGAAIGGGAASIYEATRRR